MQPWLQGKTQSYVPFLTYSLIHSNLLNAGKQDYFAGEDAT